MIGLEYDCQRIEILVQWLCSCLSSVFTQFHWIFQSIKLKISNQSKIGVQNQYFKPLTTYVINNFSSGGIQYKFRRGNSNTNGGLQQQSQGIHSRLGVVTRRGATNHYHPLAVAKRGISKRGRGLSTGNRYSVVGLRSDQILKQQRQHLIRDNNVIRSQTFRRSRNNSFNDVSQLTISVQNDLIKRRRNSVGSNNYLNKQSLADLSNQYGGYNNKKGAGSVRSNGSYKSNKSNRSNNSNRSNSSGRYGRSRGKGRGGRGAMSPHFVSKQNLNPRLQQEIAALQRSNKDEPPAHDLSQDTFTPTPAFTGQTLHQRFGL